MYPSPILTVAGVNSPFGAKPIEKEVLASSHIQQKLRN
jgi:hypothetical protein